MVFKFSLLLAAIALSFSSAFVEEDIVTITFDNLGRSPLGVFFVGNETERRSLDPKTATPEQTPIMDFEMLTGVLPRGGYAAHKTHFHHAFELRSADFQFRAKVTIYKNFHEELKHLPYIIMFKNLMSETHDGTPSYMELKHSNTGFIWIEPEGEVAHGTDENHFYELRNAERESIVQMRLIHGHPEL